MQHRPYRISDIAAIEPLQLSLPGFFDHGLHVFKRFEAHESCYAYRNLLGGAAFAIQIQMGKQKR